MVHWGINQRIFSTQVLLGKNEDFKIIFYSWRFGQNTMPFNAGGNHMASDGFLLRELMKLIVVYNCMVNLVSYVLVQLNIDLRKPDLHFVKD